MEEQDDKPRPYSLRGDWLGHGPLSVQLAQLVVAVLIGFAPIFLVWLLVYLYW